MPIFNSLGSNYNLSFSLLSLKQIILPNLQHLHFLKEKLENQFKGQVELVWKGRDALELALLSFEVGEGDVVLTQALSCYSVEEAIRRTGAEPGYVDIDPSGLNLTLDNIKQAHRHYPQAKAVILQHILGYPDETEPISRYCRQQQLVLIQDLAQSVGSLTQNQEPQSDFGQAVVLSFGRDKLIDAVSGGAVFFKQSPLQNIPVPFALDKTKPQGTARKRRLIFKDLFYPLMTWLIRHTYRFKIGLILHWLLKKTGWLYSPIETFHQHYQSLPAYYAPLVLAQLEQLKQELESRRAVSYFYYNQLKSLENVAIPIELDQIKLGANLRFPLLVSDPDGLIEFLKQRSIYLSDRWYPQPVAVGGVEKQSVYQSGSCPQAETIAEAIINLPTHRGVRIDHEADLICQAVKEWSKKQWNIRLSG